MSASRTITRAVIAVMLVSGLSVVAPSMAWAAEPPAQAAATVDVLGSPPAGKINEPYSTQFTASGPHGTRLMVASGHLPPGLTFDPATGVLSGTPTAPRPETHSFQLTAYFHSGDSDEWPQAVTRTFSIAYESSRNYVTVGQSDVQAYYHFGPMQTHDNINLWCPARTPYLINEQFHAGIMAKGVLVFQRGFKAEPTGLYMSSLAHEKDGFQAGVKNLHLYNPFLWVSGSAWVTLHCTNNQDEAARF